MVQMEGIWIWTKFCRLGPRHIILFSPWSWKVHFIGEQKLLSHCFYDRIISYCVHLTFRSNNKQMGIFFNMDCVCVCVCVCRHMISIISIVKCFHLKITCISAEVMLLWWPTQHDENCTSFTKNCWTRFEMWLAGWSSHLLDLN
jgi:hypothetical protein